MLRVLSLSFLLMVGFTLVGCGESPKKTENATATPTGAEEVMLEVWEIELLPGQSKHVAVSKGAAKSAKAPDGSGVEAKVEGNKLHVSAKEDAKPGTHNVTVEGAAKPLTVKVGQQPQD
ncbi:MAG: hypothetical protein ACK4RK_02565 [Gemmataceae bacterium]